MGPYMILLLVVICFAIGWFIGELEDYLNGR